VYIVPYNGEVNERFGVYTSVCCGLEIVISEVARFPVCPKHPKLVTKWKSTADDRIPHANELRNKPVKKNDGTAA